MNNRKPKKKKKEKPEPTQASPRSEERDNSHWDIFSLTANSERFLAELYRIRSEEIWNSFQKWCNEFQQKEHPSLSDRKYLFRGQPNKSYRLVPSALRVASYEVNKEKYIFNEFIRQAHSYYPDIQSRSCAEKMAIAQHHGLPTRLLDWSSNPYVAAFFACSGEREYFHSAIVFSKDVTIQEAPEGDLFKVKSGEVIFIKTPVAFPRIERQEGYFSLHLDPTDQLTVDIDNGFSIPAFAKEYFLRKLRNYGITDKALMADLNGVCRTLSRAYSATTFLQLNGLLVSYLGDETVELLRERLKDEAPVFETNYTVTELNSVRADPMEVIFAGIGKIFSVIVSGTGNFDQPLESRLKNMGKRGIIVGNVLNCHLNVFAHYLVEVKPKENNVSVKNASLKISFVLENQLQKACNRLLDNCEKITSLCGDKILFTDAPELDFENDILTVKGKLLKKNKMIAEYRIVFHEFCSKYQGSGTDDQIMENITGMASEPEVIPIENR